MYKIAQCDHAPSLTNLQLVCKRQNNSKRLTQNKNYLSTTVLLDFKIPDVICFRLGLYRDAERQFKSAQKQQDIVDTYLYLGKVYVRLDQPLTAVEVYKQGLEKFPGETNLLTGIARIYEVSKY